MLQQWWASAIENICIVPVSEPHLTHARAGLESEPVETRVTSRKQGWSCVEFRKWDKALVDRHGAS